MSFYLFFTFPNLKDLLLEELRRKHPSLTLSFSNKEFLSMKGADNYSNQLIRNPLIFARRMALFIDKQSSPSEYSIALKDNEFWNYKIINSKCDTFDLKEIEKPDEAPSRAWHKIQQACEFFHWEIQKGETVIEVGSAPGGISYYLLEKGAKLFAIDPAQMDNKFQNFTHIQKSIFDVDRRDLPKHCDWLVSDLNLSGDLNVAQCKRISEYYPKLKGGFITIKTPKDFDVKHMRKWESEFNRFKTTIIHLPSHRREIGLFFKI